MSARNESPGDVVVSRENLRKAAMQTIGGMQALVGFLRDRDDMSRDDLATMLEGDWRALNAAAEATPSLYGPNGRPPTTTSKEGERGG